MSGIPHPFSSAAAPSNSEKMTKIKLLAYIPYFKRKEKLLLQVKI
jgi:hypothetical protein